MVAGHLQEKKGLFYIVLNFVDAEGKRKPKWIPTGLPVKGNKRKAEALLLAERQKYQTGDYCLAADANMLFADYMLYWLRQIKSSVVAIRRMSKSVSCRFFADARSRWAVCVPVTFRTSTPTAQQSWRSATIQSSNTTQISAKPSMMPFGWRRFP